MNVNWAKLALIPLLWPEAASAVTVYLGAWSEHLAAGERNERHDLVAVEKGQWIAGTFENSYHDRTYLAGYGWDLVSVESWRFRLYGGVTYGYRRCWGDQGGGEPGLCPALVPELSYTKYRVQPALMLFGEAVAVSFKFEF